MFLFRKNRRARRLSGSRRAHTRVIVFIRCINYRPRLARPSPSLSSHFVSSWCQGKPFARIEPRTVRFQNKSHTMRSQTHSLNSRSSPTSCKIRRTSAGGLRWNFSARSQRSSLVKPSAGPNFCEGCKVYICQSWVGRHICLSLREPRVFVSFVLGSAEIPRCRDRAARTDKTGD
jgi:hypothetical protein